MAATLIVIGLTAVLAGTVHGTVGFALGIIMMLVLPAFYPVTACSALCQCGSLFVGISLVFLYHRHVNLKLCVRNWLIYFPVYFLTLLGSDHISVTALKPALGILLILVSVYGVFFSGRIRLRATLITQIICVSICAVGDMLFGIGGPPMVMFLLAATGSHEEYLGTIQATSLVANCGGLLLRLTTGRFPLEQAGTLLVMLPCMAFGIYLSRFFVKKIDRKKSGPVVYGAIGAAGLITFLVNIL